MLVNTKRPATFAFISCYYPEVTGTTYFIAGHICRGSHFLNSGNTLQIVYKRFNSVYFTAVEVGCLLQYKGLFYINTQVSGTHKLQLPVKADGATNQNDCCRELQYH